MATKKSIKVNQTKSTVPFNKRNAEQFAERIFSDKKGAISFLKLCDGELQNGKDGGRTTHCAIGEAYYTFVDHSLKTVQRKSESYDSLYKEVLESNDGPTSAAIDSLVECAQLKNPTVKNRQKLAGALADCSFFNDGEETYFDRAKEVSTIWRKSVLPLLK